MLSWKISEDIYLKPVNVLTKTFSFNKNNKEKSWGTSRKFGDFANFLVMGKTQVIYDYGQRNVGALHLHHILRQRSLSMNTTVWHILTHFQRTLDAASLFPKPAKIGLSFECKRVYMRIVDV